MKNRLVEEFELLVLVLVFLCSVYAISPLV